MAFHFTERGCKSEEPSGASLSFSGPSLPSNICFLCHGAQGFDGSFSYWTSFWDQCVQLYPVFPYCILQMGFFTSVCKFAPVDAFQALCYWDMFPLSSAYLTALESFDRFL